MEDVKAHVERVVSTKMDELSGRVSVLLSVCSKETSIKAESNAAKVQFAEIEMRFNEEHMVLVEAINAHTVATDLQTRLLEGLCQEVKLMNEKVDRLCSHAVRLENIEEDFETIANAVQGVADKTDAVSPSASSLNECIDGIKLVFEHKTKTIKLFGADFSGNAT